jgi:hypothetical protein
VLVAHQDLAAQRHRRADHGPDGWAPVGVVVGEDVALSAAVAIILLGAVASRPALTRDRPVPPSQLGMGPDADRMAGPRPA